MMTMMCTYTGLRRDALKGADMSASGNRPVAVRFGSDDTTVHWQSLEPAKTPLTRGCLRAVGNLTFFIDMASATLPFSTRFDGDADDEGIGGCE